MNYAPSRLTGATDWFDKNAHGAGGPQGETAVADLQQAGAARLQNAEAAADSKAHFRHPANHAWLARDLRHVRPVTGFKHI